MKNWFALFVALIFGQVHALAEENPVSFQAKFLGEKQDSVEIEIGIQPGWYIQANDPRDEFAIPSQIFEEGDFELGEGLSWPEPQIKFLQILNSEQELFSGNISMRSSIIPTRKNPKIFNLSLTFQACNDTLCLPPQSLSSQVLVETPKVAETKVTKKLESLDTFEEPEEAQPIQDSLFSKHLSRHWAWVVLFLLTGGVLLNLTPCVYPLLAVTVSLFGANQNRSVLQRFFMSFVYVFGMVFTFSGLGLMAALSGKLFGSVLQSPWVQGGIGAVFILLAISSFGLFELRLPSSVMTRANTASNAGGLVGSLLAGLFSGVLASPCIGPFVLGLIVYVGEKQDPYQGFWMFALLGLGMGLPYLVLGTLSGLLQKLPRSGNWMVEVKKIIGLILLGLANYYLRGYYPNSVYTVVMGLLLMLGGLFVNPFQNITQISKMASALIRLVAFLVLGYGTILLLQGSGILKQSVAVATAETVKPLKWDTYTEARLKSARQNQYVLVDFESKVWCVACREMEEKTFSQKEVKKILAEVKLLKVDVDKHPDVNLLTAKYRVHGIPTAILIDKQGKEVERFIGFVGPEKFVRRIENAKKLSGLGE